MRRLSLVALFLCATGLLSACQLPGGKIPAKPDGGVTPNAVAGSAIEVTALDAPPVETVSAPAVAAETAGQATAVPQADPVVAEDGTATETGPSLAPKPDLAETPVTPKSEMQLACEKKGGRWFKVGKGEKRACVRQTKDANKRCEKESQCDGVCLARSGTCSPFKPLYGCNEILQDNGARVTLCLE